MVIQNQNTFYLRRGRVCGEWTCVGEWSKSVRKLGDRSTIKIGKTEQRERIVGGRKGTVKRCTRRGEGDKKKGIEKLR